jgi:hypothetical protein
LGQCPHCDNKLALVSDALFCHECRLVVEGGVNTLRLEAQWTDATCVQKAVEKLANPEVAGNDRPAVYRLIHHGQQVYQVRNNKLLPLNHTRESIERVRQMLNFAEGALIRMPTRDEAAAVITKIQEETWRFPLVDLVAPAPLLYRNHENRLVPTRPGLNGRIYQTGPNIEPAATGAWTELMDMTPFATGRDRETFEAYAMAALCPLEYTMGPLLVMYADGQNAGKTWLIRYLTRLLGYETVDEMNLTKNAGKFRREVLAAMMGGRVMLWDNVVGSGFSFIEHNGLSAMLTTDWAKCGALYKVGTEVVKNHHLWVMSMNGGRLCEDLASRSISCKLIYDPDDPRIVKRAQLGEGYWKRPENAKRLLQELMLRTLQSYEYGRVMDEALIDRPQDWHRLVQALGCEVRGCSAEIREAGDFDEDWLRKIVGTEGTSIQDLCLRVKASGAANAFGKAANVSYRQLGLLLVRASAAGAPIYRHHTKAGTRWYTG